MRFRLLPGLLALYLSLCASFRPSLGAEPSQPTPQEARIDPDATLSFEKQVRPILKTYCLDCHGAREETEGKLDLRLRRWIARGGESGPAIVPGQADASLLVRRVRAGEMPPGEKKVPVAEQEVLARWVAAGAPSLRAEPESLPPGIDITPEERSFWSFQPIRRPQPFAATQTETLSKNAVSATSSASTPSADSSADSARVRTAIDALVVAKLRARGLAFAPEADRRTLARRAFLDLTGLPPTWDELLAFLADTREDAYEHLIDQLLESPRYGERWGRHWLDAAGYADSEGYTSADEVRPWAHKYRDYVIQSLQADKPWNEFLIEQLAGDELVPPPYADLTPERIDTLVATGFLRMAADGTGSGADTNEARNQTIADTLKIVSTSLLGLSVGCAQCHDHRYDPIPQADYYRLRAIFEPALDWKNWRTPQQRRISLYTAADRQHAAAVEAEAQGIVTERAEKEKKYIGEALAIELGKHPEALREPLRAAFETPDANRSAEQKELLAKYPSVNIRPGVLYQYNQAAADELKKYDARIAETRGTKRVEEFISPLTEVAGQSATTFVFHRGDFNQPTKEVAPGDLTIAFPAGERHDIPADDPALPTTGRRLAYARWLTNGRHPLVARVLVNRFWMHHFGRGIVGTPGDFGMLGQRPTHAELLDWLADEFMARQWSLKALHREIMRSTVYRQSSVAPLDALAVDADNELLGRFPVQRLDAESIRDRVLATNGTLASRMYGPPVPVRADETGQIVADSDESRRTVYVQARRSQPVALLQAFDAPIMETNCDCRRPSTAATQALMLLNGDFALRHARRFAERVRREAESTVVPAEAPRLSERLASRPWAAEITRAWQLAYGRLPEPTEWNDAASYLDQQLAQLATVELKEGDPPLYALAGLCQVLMSSNEFLYVD